MGSIWGRQINAGTPKSTNNITSTFVNTTRLLPKDFKFEHGGTKHASCHGRRLTSSRSWLHYNGTLQGWFETTFLGFAFRDTLTR